MLTIGSGASSNASAQTIWLSGFRMPWIEIVLLVFITVPIALLIHELGHFVAARILRLEVLSFQAGPFLVVWKNGIGAFRLEPRLWLAAGGVRVKAPAEISAKKRILLTAAGPAASLLFSGIYWLAPVSDEIYDMDLTPFRRPSAKPRSSLPAGSRPLATSAWTLTPSLIAR